MLAPVGDAPLDRTTETPTSTGAETVLLCNGGLPALKKRWTSCTIGAAASGICASHPMTTLMSLLLPSSPSALATSSFALTSEAAAAPQPPSTVSRLAGALDLPTNRPPATCSNVVPCRTWTCIGLVSGSSEATPQHPGKLTNSPESKNFCDADMHNPAFSIMPLGDAPGKLPRGKTK